MNSFDNIEAGAAQLFGKIPSDEELIENMVKSEIWKTSYDYTKEPFEIYKGNDIILLPFCEATNLMVQDIQIYLYGLGQILLYYAPDDKEYPEFMKDEIKRANGNGQLCIYLSVLTILLLEKNEIIPKDTVKLIQGWYEYDVPEGSPAFFMAQIISNMNKKMKCAHAFVTFPGGFVFDRAFNLDNGDMINTDNAFILGVVPDGVTFAGYEESSETVYEYGELFARSSERTIDEWLDKHMEHLIIAASNYRSFENPLGLH